MIPGRKEWNTQLIARTFLLHDTDQILNIHLFEYKFEDFIAWNYEKNGMLSVKSAYKLAYNLTVESPVQEGASRAGDCSRPIWRNIRSAPMPNKVHAFVWRLAADNLATKRNKLKHTLEVNSPCSG